MGRVVVVAGGSPPPTEVTQRLHDVTSVVAADSGFDHAVALGLEPTVLVGDLDSISADGLRRAEDAGIDIRRYPANKDATDLELALDAAMDLGDEIVVVDGGEGRLDHRLGNLLLLASHRYAEVEVSALVGPATVSVCRRHRRLRARVGDLVTLLPVAGEATGVSTRGLQWQLDAATLGPGSTRGISNVFVATEATIETASGVLLAIQP